MYIHYENLSHNITQTYQEIEEFLNIKSDANVKRSFEENSEFKTWIHVEDLKMHKTEKVTKNSNLILKDISISQKIINLANSFGYFGDKLSSKHPWIPL